uniref:hypothetical protein n=1 Tax=Psychromonas sp. Urea-02u-13 TaxID=2058326 RepID=UPI000CAC72ED
YIDLDAQELAEIEAIQAAIEENDEPIEDVETAAGETGDGGSSSAVDFSRDGAETQASSDFQTEGFDFASQNVEITDNSALQLAVTTEIIEPQPQPDTTVIDQDISYAENQSVDAVVGTLKANADVASYTFENGGKITADGYYTINNAGQITITAVGAAAHVNNFEQDDNDNSGDYVVIAKDTALNETEFTLTLAESDIDEIAPSVVAQTVTYAENQVSGAEVGSLAENTDVASYVFKDSNSQTSEDGFYSIDNAGKITITDAGATATLMILKRMIMATAVTMWLLPKTRH